MKFLFSKAFSFLLIAITLLSFSSCSNGTIFSRKGNGVVKNAPTGKDETTKSGYFSNSYKGKSRAALKKFKKKKNKKLSSKQIEKRNKKRNKKAVKRIKKSRTIKKGRIKSSGSNFKRSSRSGGGKKNKNLFNTRKK